MQRQLFVGAAKVHEVTRIDVPCHQVTSPVSALPTRRGHEGECGQRWVTKVPIAQVRSRKIQFAECTIRSGGEDCPENVSADAGQSGAQRRCPIAGDVVRCGHDGGFTGSVQVEHVRACCP